jgi:hypothetical protein
MSLDAVGERSTEHRFDGPTPVSIWRAASGGPITDELLEWPPDLFALTSTILERSQAYRFAWSPPGHVTWPPSRDPSWPDAVEGAAREWSACVEDRTRSLPELLATEWRVFQERAGQSLEGLAEGRDWRGCESLLTLHAIADEACAGLGVAFVETDAMGCVYRARGRELLARTGSLARIHSHFLRVLPRVRTPAPGVSSLSSLSRYACVQRPGVDVRWHKVPARHGGTDPRVDHANFLLLPWPLRVRETDFRPVEGSIRGLDSEPSGQFEFAPPERLDLDLVSRTVAAAREEAGTVDVVVLPESAVDERDIGDLETLLDRHAVISLITGVRHRPSQPGELPGNWVQMSVSPRLEKGGQPPTSTSEQWFRIRQQKHHPWSLDAGQIYQYHLGGALHPNLRWWEAMEMPRRSVQFMEIGEEVMFIALVCEDLAQIDDVAETVRSVGPTVVFTLLLDGPQLASRWAARYASVLADDPGSAVLTLTSFGMVQRSRPHGHDASPIIALWRDPNRGTREIPLEAGAQGVLLTTCGERTIRRTADGRWPVENAMNWFDVATSQVRAVAPSSGSRPSVSGTTVPSPLEVDDVTVLTAVAQSVAEVIANAPERLEDVLATGRAGAEWRTAFGIPEPSSALIEAIDVIARSARGAAADGSLSALDAAIAAARTDELHQDGLNRLASQVLRSTLEQRRFRAGERRSNAETPSGER